MAGAPGLSSSYNIAPGESTDAAAIRRKLALALMQQSADPSPIQHWTQGAARIAQAMMGGYELHRADQDDREDRSKTRAIMTELAGGGNPQPAPVAPISPTAPRRGQLSAEITSPQSAPVKDVYAGNEQSPFDPVPGAITPNMGRLLAALQPGESGGRPNVMYGGKTFSDFSQHPNQPQPISSGPNKGNVSTAAGTYQFIKPTWDRAQQALGLPDFSPGNQNAAAAYTASADYEKRTGIPLERAMTEAGNDPQKLQQIAKALAPTWTSLPGGIEQNAGGQQFAQIAGNPQTMTDISAQRQPAQGAVGAPVDQPRGGLTDGRRLQLITALSQTKAGAPYAQALFMKELDREGNRTRPLSEQERAIYPGAVAIEASGKPVFPPPSTNVQLSTVANPVLEGVGKQIVDQRKAAQTAAAETIPAIHDARKAFDSGTYTGAFAEGRLGLAKIGNLFGLGEDKAANTEVFRSAIGDQVLSSIKALGANPSNTDREYIEKIKGGQVALEENAVRKLLDIQEKYARRGIQNFNRDAQKLMGASPEGTYKGIAPLMSIEEPGVYQAPAIQQPQAAPDRAAIEQEMRKRGLIK